MFSAGAHFGLGRSRRNPTVAPYIFGSKNDTDIFDLEKTAELVGKVLTIAETAGREGKTILFVGGKREASQTIKAAAESQNMPYVDGRWIGGTISNFGQIRKRIDRMEKLVADKEKGELAKYTKRERMLIDKEIADLQKMFAGIASLKKLPDILFVIDPRREKNAVKEARDFNIPVIALCGSDCNISEVTHPIIGNDSSKTSIAYFVNEIVGAFEAGKNSRN